MTLWLSRPFEELQFASAPVKTHTLIVGSGYGAAFAALALALRGTKPYQNSEIMVLERGRERVPGDFPKTFSDLPAHLSMLGTDGKRLGNPDALIDVRQGHGASCIVGSGLGGTSLINANVAIAPNAEVLERWPQSSQQRPWLEELAPSVQFAQSLLNVARHPNGMALPKVRALQQLAGAIEGCEHRLADLAVNFNEGANTVGLQQRKCNDCGNCFTGCNIGAKNSLALNAWPLARQLGVDIVTGGSVASVERSADPDYPWQVNAHRTGNSDAASILLAKRVILAGGTFGTTDILKRSSSLKFSSQLGKRFSLNGDGIAFGFGQRRPVAAHAKVPSDCAIQPRPEEAPGPTIVSMIRVGQGQQRMLIEDATVPQAITRIWAEVLTTQAMTHGYISNKCSAWHAAHPSADRLAVSDELMAHHQVLLSMGTDDSLGSIQWKPAGTIPDWRPSSSPGHESDTAACTLHSTLQAAHARGGFDDGLYLSNPFWKPLPEAFDQVFEGASAFGGMQFSNHPLGGCSMDTTAEAGVVNTSGQLFAAATGQATYAGLYVLDGSIIPGALGINPFLTIAALAHHLATQIDGDAVREQFRVPQLCSAMTVPIKAGQQVEWPLVPRDFTFRERLFGPADPTQARAIAKVLAIDTGEPNSLILDIDFKLPGIETWAARPRMPLEASCVLYRNKEPDRVIDTIEDKWLTSLREPAVKTVGSGRVRLFATDAWPCTVLRWVRGVRAILRFHKLRGAELADQFQALEGANQRSLFKRLVTLLRVAASDPSALKRIAGFARVAMQHAHWRRLDYSLRCKLDRRTIAIHGVKTLGYRSLSSSAGDPNPWATLTNIQLHFVDRRTGRRASGWFRVDLVRMAKDITPLQVNSGAETPQVLLSVGALGALAARALLQTHLWSFGAPPYKYFQDKATVNELRLAPAPPVIEFGPSDQQLEFDCEVVRSQDSRWRLLRANVKHRTRSSPVLLIHGLAHSSRVFYTNTVDHNLAGSLMKEGYEVWMLDHGLSTSLDQPDYDPTIDEIGLQVTAALKHIYTATRDYRQPGNAVKVFSHCVGSVATTMSILSGNNYLDGQPLIESLVMHAVPPWIRPSESNLLRAYVGVFFKDRFFPQSIDPIAYRPAEGESTLLNTLLDRLAGSIAWSETELAPHSCGTDHHFAHTLCNRMTAFYGYEWLHENLDPRTHSRLAELIGPANGTAFRQLYFLLNRRRVTDSEGRNVYMQTPAFVKHWRFPTLFLHGTLNKVFDIESSRLSAHQLGQLALSKDGEPEFKVAFHAVRNYGHMDVLFGKNAWRDVFPHIAAHFADGTAQVLRLPLEHQPKSETRATTRTQSGPIISRPTRIDGRLYLRVWCETNEFQTSVVQNIRLECPTAVDGKLSGRWDVRSVTQLAAAPADAPTNACNELGNSRFWLGEFDCEAVGSGVTPVVELDAWGLEGGEHPEDLNLPPEPKQAAAKDAIEWHELAWFKRARSLRTHTQLAFICGSCWYPGSWFDRDVADRVFRNIRSHIEAVDGIDHLLLLGDQIYADATAAIFDIAEDRERFQERYRKAFNSPSAAWVLQRVPTYFAVDDHEFSNDYPDPATLDAPRRAELSRAAQQEAWNFQMHHAGVPDALDHRLYYCFESAGFHFMVLDTRSERSTASDVTGLNRLMFTAQQAELKRWLRSVAPDKPCFIACGSPPMAVPADEIKSPALARSSDTLRAYPELLSYIAHTAQECGIRRKIVLLSGDSHYSSLSEFHVSTLQGKHLASFVCIVASGINAPLPFANERSDSVDWQHPPPCHVPYQADYKIRVERWSKLSTSRAHAVRVDLQQQGDQWQLNVKVIDADGHPPTLETSEL